MPCQPTPKAPSPGTWTTHPSGPRGVLHSLATAHPGSGFLHPFRARRGMSGTAAVPPPRYAGASNDCGLLRALRS